MLSHCKTINVVNKGTSELSLERLDNNLNDDPSAVKKYDNIYYNKVYK